MEKSSKFVLVTLDGDCLPKTVIAKQGDSGTRELRIAFVETATDTSRIALEENTNVKIRFKLRDGSAYSVEAELNASRNSATAMIPTEALVEPGKLLVDICLYQDDFILSTSTFDLRVLESATGTSSGSVVIGGQFFNTVALTRAQYESIEPTENTIYLVDDSFYEGEMVITLCLGSKQLVSTGLTQGSFEEEQNALSLFLQRAVSELHQYYSRMYTLDEDYTTVLERKRTAPYDPSEHEYLKLGAEPDEEVGYYKIAELKAEDKIYLKTDDHTFEINSDGLFFDGRKLSGGTPSVGQMTSQINGLTSSEIGELTEVT